MVWAATLCLGSSGGRSTEPVTAHVNDLNWRERKLPTSGRGVSEPLQLKCLVHTGSAGPNETIPEGTVGSDVVEMSKGSNKALNRK